MYSKPFCHGQPAWNRANRAPPVRLRRRVLNSALPLIALMLTVVGIGTVDAAVRYVRASAPGPTYDGTSWASAYTNLQSALTPAIPGDEIWVAAGVYKPTGTTNRTIGFVLKSGVAMFGGFPVNGGNGTFTDRNPGLFVRRTILSGDVDNNDTNLDSNNVAEVTGHIQGNNSFHILKSESPVSSTTIVDGFLLTAGNANGSGVDSGGGAFRNVNGSAPTLRNLRFEGNSAASGAAIYNEGSNPILEDILFVNNQTAGTDGGGGMRNLASAHPILNRVQFISNTGFRGGGMRNSGKCRPILTDVDFVANSGLNMGGGLYNEDSSPQLNQVEFYGNVGNFGGAAVNNSTSAPVFVNCLFRDNRAFQAGGAIYNVSSDPRFVNSTFSQNIAGDRSGALENFLSAPIVQNCILWGNTGAGTAPSQIEGSVIGALSTNNLIEGGYSPRQAAVVSTANPLFVNPATDNFRLQPNSPAAGAGLDNLVPAGVVTDLDGRRRIVPLAVDLGAYESQQLSFNPVPSPAPVPTLPTNSPTIVADWIPGGTGLRAVFNHLASSGDVAFLVPPSVAPNGTLTFTVVPGTSGRALFDVWLVDPNGVFASSQPVRFSIPVSKLVAVIHPQISFDYTASQIGPGPGPTARAAARIRAYRHPAGQRKGVAIFPGTYSGVPTLPAPSNEVIHPVTGAFPFPTNGSPLIGNLQLAWSEGFDVYAVQWHDPRTYLQANAMILVDVLTQMATGGFPIAPGQVESIAPGDKVALVGNSMGGLVARFALCYLDKLQIPYRCDLFLSLDAPQEGAYIPVGLQHLAVVLNGLSEGYKKNIDTSALTDSLDAINQPSPRQMLLLHHSRSNVAPYYAQERSDFLSLLAAHGNWPTNRNLRMAAVSNGRGDGSFEERGGVGAFATWPKPDGELRIIDWNITRQVDDTTNYITDPRLFLCFWGTLRVAITGYLATTVYALNPSSPFAASDVFRGVASATISVTGRNTNVLGNVMESSGTTQIDTSGSDEQIVARLREFIRQAGGLTGVGCDVAGIFLLNQMIEGSIAGFLPQITEIRDLNKIIRARSGQHWEWLPGGWGNKGEDAATALGAAGTVTRVSGSHCYIPTVSALAISQFVSPEGVAIPANAVELSPFHALYHFGARRNTGHLEDFNGWLSDIVSHELRMLCGQFHLGISAAPLRPVTWRGAYTLQTSADPAGPWASLFRDQDGVHIPSTPLPSGSFFRLRFSHVYR